MNNVATSKASSHDRTRSAVNSGPLSDVASGRILFQSVASERGEFTFTAVPPGSYVSEFLDGDDRVLAYGEVFGIRGGPYRLDS